jgi:hypothetical protein
VEAAAPVTVERAAVILGVSPSTVHRRIRSGALRAEQAERPQGRVWLVHLPPGTTVAAEEPPPPTAPEATAPPTVAAQAEAMVSLIQTTIGTVLGPLVSQLDAQRQTIERQADRVADLERENGRQSAELERAASIAVKLSDDLEAARAQMSTLTAPAASGSVEQPTRRPGGFWPPCAVWLVAVLAIVGTGVLLVVSR